MGGDLENLKKLTLAMGAVSLGLSFYIAHSLHFTTKNGIQSLARFPASLIVGETAEPKKGSSVSKVVLTCRELMEKPHLDIRSPMLQFEFNDCSLKKPIELINLTNGYQATLFSTSTKVLSDLVSLKQGTNEIHVRLEKVPVPYTFKVNSSN